ncbi:unnamed protein product [Urochloa decumbens]|uniref:peptidylprolyl isomerase n=1 Tax=Urochloa decumbens TaxID=240449 RepID=A0ABC9FH68_9POAL
MGKDSKPKESKSKDAKGKGKAGPSGGDDAGGGKGGKGKGGKSADGLGTCTYVKARHVLCEKQGKINEAYKKLQDGWLDNGDKVPPAEFAKPRSFLNAHQGRKVETLAGSRAARWLVLSRRLHSTHLWELLAHHSSPRMGTTLSSVKEGRTDLGVCFGLGRPHQAKYETQCQHRLLAQ